MPALHSVSVAAAIVRGNRMLLVQRADATQTLRVVTAGLPVKRTSDR